MKKQCWLSSVMALSLTLIGSRAFAGAPLQSQGSGINFDQGAGIEEVLKEIPRPVHCDQNPHELRNAAARTEVLGSFVFEDNKLLDSTVNQILASGGSGRTADAQRASSTKVLSDGSVRIEGESDDKTASTNVEPAALAAITGIYDIHQRDGNLACRIFIDANGNAKAFAHQAKSLTEISDADLFINRVSAHVLVLSCIMSHQENELQGLADEGPGTVHGCMCYTDCTHPPVGPPWCHQVCSCWNKP